MLPPGEGDVIKLKYVMYELLTNAIKYTREGGILLTSEANGETVVIQVRDTGRGISAENIPTLFESFEKTNIMNVEYLYYQKARQAELEAIIQSYT